MFQKNETSADNLQAQKDSPNELATTVYESTQNITWWTIIISKKEALDNTVPVTDVWNFKVNKRRLLVDQGTEQDSASQHFCSPFSPPKGKRGVKH